MKLNSLKIVAVVYTSFRLRGLDCEFLKSKSYYYTQLPTNLPQNPPSPPSRFLSQFWEIKKSHFYITREIIYPPMGCPSRGSGKCTDFECFSHILDEHPEVNEGCDWYDHASSP